MVWHYKTNFCDSLKYLKTAYFLPFFGVTTSYDVLGFQRITKINILNA